MSLSLAASADGNTVDLVLGSTIIARFSASGVESGVLIASDAEAQGLTNLKKLLSPEKLDKAFKGANQALTGNGYQRLPGGAILQWGSLTNSATPGAATAVVFPIAFPTTCRAVIPVGESTNTSGISAWISDRTNSGFNSRGSIANLGASWFAIGY